MITNTLRLIFVFLLLAPALSNAQNPDERILMTAGGHAVKAGEFIRMYNKAPATVDKNEFDAYLQQFITFRLKVADAIANGYDTTSAFKNELSGYRKQLAQSYLTDTDTRENLLKKAYERYLTDINAWHILVTCPPDASPSDTLRAWRKALEIRERTMSGEHFESVARSTSEDPSVVSNGGNLGYFTVFQMILPFEEAAYSLKKGAISMPVRTSYGYHIIKVADRRPSRGKVRVAHIMKAAPPGIGEEEAAMAEAEIKDIYEQIIRGASFSRLAKERSDHRESSPGGGELNWFGTGEIISDFSEAAFTLKDTGDITPPVRTLYGWHIIKLLEKRDPGTFEQTKSFLESKINQSYLSSLSKKSLISRLRKEYNFSINTGNFSWFVRNTDTLIINGISGYTRTNIPGGDIYKFADQSRTTSEFADYIERRGSMINARTPELFIQKAIEAMSDDHIIDYEESLLEKKYPEFGYLIKEFHDGILMFEISADKIWNRVQTDSAGLKDYYNENKGKFPSPRSIDAKEYTLRERLTGKAEKQFRTFIRRNSRRSDGDRRIKEKYNTGADTILYITEGNWRKGDDPELDKLNWNRGMHFFRKNGYPSALLISRVNDSAPMPLNEVKGEIMSMYQDELENEWIKQLKEKYPVKIDNAVLKEVRQRLENE